MFDIKKISEKISSLFGAKKEQNDTSVLKTMEEKDMSRVNRTQRVVQVLVKIALYAFLLTMAVIVLFPFYWMLISSVKSLEEYNLSVPTLFPEAFHFENYVEGFKTANLGQLFLNTVFVGVVSTILSLVITVLSAFAFARLEFVGKNALFAALLATMMIPGELFTITNYQTINDFFGLKTLGNQIGSKFLQEIGNWQNTYTVLIVPFLVSVFYIYLLKQNFMQIPNELYLAAKVDGTTDIKYLWKVMIPLAFPTIISITILKMMGAWNSYIWPRLVANDDAHKLITNGLRGADFTVDSMVHYPRQMAAVAIVSLPLFLVFLFFRKYIMKGVSRSGIKG
ncbi:MAG: carbohydrate ABC transporter permease [Clostridia bacterium]|nr:carbohydrate ABC transporter permease [Clostridia bacterium]